MTAFATVTSKYQLNIPVAMAQLAGLFPGSRVSIGLEEGKVLVEKISSLDELHEVLSSLPLAKKYTVSQATKIARKKEALRIANEA